MIDAPRERIAAAMDYPFARPAHSFLFVDGAALALAFPGEESLDAALARRGGAPMAERTAVLAYGANAAPERLRRKFSAQAPGVVFPVLKSRLHDFDIVYACHFSSYGALPATLAPCPGSVAEITLTYLDRDQLARMHETELSSQNYVFGRLDGVAVEPEGREALDAVHGYWARHGFFFHAAGPLALSAIAARGRRFAQAAQEAVQGQARDRLAPGRDLHAFVAENASDPALRRERSLALRANARPFTPRHSELLAG